MPESGNLSAPQESSAITPWPVPNGGLDRQIRPSRYEQNRQPLSAKQIWAWRLTYLAIVIGSGCVLVSVHMPAGHLSAESVGLIGFVNGVANFLFTKSGYQRRQILGSAPATPSKAGNNAVS